MKSLLFFFSILCCLWGFSQRFSSDIFHKGYLVTAEKDTLKGELKYDLEANVLTLVGGGKTWSFSSHKIFYFEIFDKIQNNYRQFYSIPYNVNFDYKIPVFFEVVYEGKLSLLRREQIVTRSVNNSSVYWGGGNVRQNVLGSDQYRKTLNINCIRRRLTYIGSIQLSTPTKSQESRMTTLATIIVTIVINRVP